MLVLGDEVVPSVDADAGREEWARLLGQIKRWRQDLPDPRRVVLPRGANPQGALHLTDRCSPSDELHPASRIGRDPTLSQERWQLGVAKVAPHVNPVPPDVPASEVVDGSGHPITRHADRSVQQEVIDPGCAQEGRFAPLLGLKPKPPSDPPWSPAIEVAPGGPLDALATSNQLLHGLASMKLSRDFRWNDVPREITPLGYRRARARRGGKPWTQL